MTRQVLRSPVPVPLLNPTTAAFMNIPASTFFLEQFKARFTAQAIYGVSKSDVKESLERSKRAFLSSLKDSTV